MEGSGEKEAKSAQLAGGEGVTEQDAQFVRARLEAIAKASVHGAYNSRMTADPDFVSKAVFEWWWKYRGHRARIPQYRPANWGRSDAGAQPGVPRRSTQVCAPPPAAVIQAIVSALLFEWLRFVPEISACHAARPGNG